MKKNIHRFETDVNKISKKCILCGKKIIDTEFEYEDYFIVFRGFTKNCCYGFICFECYENRKSKR